MIYLITLISTKLFWLATNTDQEFNSVAYLRNSIYNFFATKMSTILMMAVVGHPDTLIIDEELKKKNVNFLLKQKKNQLNSFPFSSSLFNYRSLQKTIVSIFLQKRGTHLMAPKMYLTCSSQLIDNTFFA